MLIYEMLFLQKKKPKLNIQSESIKAKLCSMVSLSGLSSPVFGALQNINIFGSCCIFSWEFHVW